MSRLLVLVGVGLGMFGLAMTTGLWTKGRLSREGLSEAGLLSVLFSRREAPQVRHNEGHRSASALRPFTANEITALVQDLRAQKSAWEEKRRQLEVFDERLALYRKNLERVREELDEQRAALGAYETDLKRREADLASKIVLIRQAEEENLRRSAAIYESMTADAAARILGRGTEDEAAKILSRMDERRAARVLEAMQPEAGARIAARLKTLVVESSPGAPSP